MTIHAFDAANDRETKTSIVLDMLARPQGATLDEIAGVTGWKPHTVRGWLSGIVRKRRRIIVERIMRESGEYAYVARS